MNVEMLDCVWMFQYRDAEDHYVPIQMDGSEDGTPFIHMMYPGWNAEVQIFPARLAAFLPVYMAY